MIDVWLPIRYRDFHDVPRAFVVEYGGVTFLFDCLFDYDRDDYEPTYAVYRVPAEVAGLLDETSWTDLGHRCVPVGWVWMTDVEFDETRRKAVRSRIFDMVQGFGGDPAPGGAA